MKLINLKSFWPAIGMFLLATALFCIPGDRLPDEDWLGKISIDKIVHIGLFAALVILWGLPFIARANAGTDSQRSLRRTMITIVVMAVLYGVAIEFIQGAFIPNRSYSLADMVADALGSLAGGVLLRSQRKAAMNQLKN